MMILIDHDDIDNDGDDIDNDGDDNNDDDDDDVLGKLVDGLCQLSSLVTSD